MPQYVKSYRCIIVFRTCYSRLFYLSLFQFFLGGSCDYRAWQCGRCVSVHSTIGGFRSQQQPFPWPKPWKVRSCGLLGTQLQRDKKDLGVSNEDEMIMGIGFEFYDTDTVIFLLQSMLKARNGDNKSRHKTIKCTFFRVVEISASTATAPLSFVRVPYPLVLLIQVFSLQSYS